MKKLLLSSLFAFAGILIASAQSFQGVIEFKKQTSTDTVNYIYYIKGDKVRLDEIGSKSKKVEGSFIIDLKTNKIFSLSHERKIFIEQAAGSPAVMKGKAEAKKTGKVKTIQGTKCAEYIVKNEDEKVQVTYWMGGSNFNFFFKLLKVLNRKDKSAVYIQQLKKVDGKFPFLSTQINLETKKVDTKMEITKLQKKKVDDSMFIVPKDYQKFQK